MSINKKGVNQFDSDYSISKKYSTMKNKQVSENKSDESSKSSYISVPKSKASGCDEKAQQLCYNNSWSEIDA